MKWLVVIDVPEQNGRQAETIRVQTDARWPSQAMAEVARLGVEPEGPCIVHIQPDEETAA